MAAPGGKFYIQDVMKDVAPHHESFAKLWETKWRKLVRCSLKSSFEITHVMPTVAENMFPG